MAQRQCPHTNTVHPILHDDPKSISLMAVEPTGDEVPFISLAKLTWMAHENVLGLEVAVYDAHTRGPQEVKRREDLQSVLTEM